MNKLLILGLTAGLFLTGCTNLQRAIRGNDYVDSSLASESSSKAAEKQKEEQEMSRLQAEKEQKIRDLAEQYRTNYFGNVYFDTYSFSEKYKNKTCQIKNLKLSELLEMIERLENMIINRTCLMEEHIKDYIVKRYNMD